MVPSGNGNQYFPGAQSHKRRDNPRFSHPSGRIPRPRSVCEEIYKDFSAAKDWLVPAARGDPGARDTGLNTCEIRADGSVERRHTVCRRIWYSRREEGITSWEDSRYPRDLVNRCSGPRNFKPRADTFDSRAISSARSELADSTSWHTSYFTYVIFFTRSAPGALSKTVISSPRGAYLAQFRVNRRFCLRKNNSIFALALYCYSIIIIIVAEGERFNASFYVRC